MSLRKRMLDWLLGMWAVLVIFRFVGPYVGLQAPALMIDLTGLHVAFLGVCLALAAVDAALDATRAR